MKEFAQTMRQNWWLIALTVILFTGAIVVWFNSPLYAEYYAAARETTLRELALNYNELYRLSNEDIEKAKEKFQITDDEIKSRASVSVLVKFISGEVYQEEATPTLDVMEQLDSYFKPLLAFGVIIFIYREFKIKEVVKKVWRERGNEKGD